MADTIILRVDLQNEAAVISGLSKIDQVANQLRNKTITINVKGNADTVSKSVIQLANAQAKAEAAAARRATAEAKVGVAQANAQAAASRAAQQEAKLTAQREKGAAAANKEASAVNNLGNAAKNAASQGNVLTNAFGNLWKMAAWQIGGNIVSSAINSVKNAFQTIKDVDEGLITIQKTAGATAAEMSKISDNAYSTASKYGVSATEYLESVAEFTRAGYFDIADQFGELAIKTQLVGDTTAETADKFLLAVNAAWQYDGSIQELSAVVDKADAVNNNYATNLDKIAAGMPIVANVAATAGMSVEQTIAMLGTITAVTQESGTKAATAARALILNIMGDTTTEIEEGVTLAKEQVDDLSDILWKYSRDAMEAAQATGEIVNPMEAIAGLAKASQEGLLTEAELARIAADIGGKLRTNQLLALINNWDMFNAQLETMAQSAGTADAEIGIMLDSWTAKSQQVKNSWAELWATIADTDAIKDGLDIVNNIVSGITDLFNGQEKVETLATRYHNQGMSVEAAAMRAYAEVNNLYDATTGLPDYKNIDIETPGIQEAIERLKEVDALSGDVTKTVTVKTSGYAALWPGHAAGTKNAPGGPTLVNELGPEMISANGLAWIAGGGQPTVTNLPRGAVVLTAQQTRRALNGLGGISAIPAYGGGTTTDPNAAISAALTSFLVSVNQVGTGGSSHRSGGGYSGSSGSFALTEEDQIRAAENAANAAALSAAAIAEARRQESINRYSGEYSGTEPDNTVPRGGGGRTAAAAAVDLKQAQKDLDDALKNLKAQAQLADNRGEHGIEGDLYGTAQERIREMLAAYREAGYEDTSDEILELENLLFDYADKQEKAYQHVWDELETGLNDTLKNLKAQIELAENQGDYSAQDRLLGQARDEISALLQKYREAGYSETSDEVLRLQNLLYDYAEQQEKARKEVWDAMEDGLDDALKNINAQIELAENRGDIAGRMRLYTEAQDKIAALIEQYLAAGYATDSDEILRLTNLGYDYAGKQTGLRDSLYQELIDAIEGLKDSTDEANALAEKQHALETAREAYENASRQRTVRIFNPVTGQWEWVANQKDVQAAQEKLKSAEESLKDAQWAQAISAARSGEIGLGELIAGEPVSAAYDSAGQSARSAFLDAMEAYTGGANYAASTEGERYWSQSDSHDTVYQINGITITPDSPAYLTMQTLAQQLSVLKIM